MIILTTTIKKGLLLISNISLGPNKLFKFTSDADHTNHILNKNQVIYLIINSILALLQFNI